MSPLLPEGEQKKWRSVFGGQVGAGASASGLRFGVSVVSGVNGRAGVDACGVGDCLICGGTTSPRSLTDYSTGPDGGATCTGGEVTDGDMVACSRII